MPSQEHAETMIARSKYSAVPSAQVRETGKRRGG